MQELHHALELAQHRARAAELGIPGGVARVRREEAEGVVAPVVDEAHLLQALLGDVLVHREQLDRRDAEVLEIGDRRRMREARVGAAQLLRHVGVELREALHVGLVDDGVVERDAGLARVTPVERVVLHVAAPLARLRAGEAARVGVEQIAARVERVRRSLRSARLERVVGAGGEIGGGAAPYARGILREGHRRRRERGVLAVEDAQVDGVRGGAPDADLAAVGGRAHAEVAQRVAREGTPGGGSGHAFQRMGS